MTVGVGYGKNVDKRTASLAHGLIKSIHHYKPDKIVFFGSDKSVATIESLEEQYEDKYNKKLENFEMVKLDNIDDFQYCYSKMKEKVVECEGNEIYMDYTSGTKTMTMSIAVISILFHKTLTLITGKRGENGIVISKTERISEQNLYSVYDDQLLEKVKEQFNKYKFEAAFETLKEVVSLEEKDRFYYQTIIEAYNSWDKFEHSEAYEKLSEINGFGTNKGFLGILLGSDREPEIYFIIDLLNNAARRIEEGKYDDALVRLYRTMELIGEYRLKSVYNISSSDVDLDILKKKLPEIKITLYGKFKGKDGKIKLTLYNMFALLADLTDNYGQKFIEDGRMKDLMNKRNSSILAHGLEPIKKENVIKLQKAIMEYAEPIISERKNIKEFLKKGQFPKINKNFSEV